MDSGPARLSLVPFLISMCCIAQHASAQAAVAADQVSQSEMMLRCSCSWPHGLWHLAVSSTLLHQHVLRHVTNFSMTVSGCRSASAWRLTPSFGAAVADGAGCS